MWPHVGTTIHSLRCSLELDPPPMGWSVSPQNSHVEVLTTSMCLMMWLFGDKAFPRELNLNEVTRAHAPSAASSVFPESICGSEGPCECTICKPGRWDTEDPPPLTLISTFRDREKTKFRCLWHPAYCTLLRKLSVMESQFPHLKMGVWRDLTE